MKIKNLFQKHNLISGKHVLAITIAFTFLCGTSIGSFASGHVWESTGNVSYQDEETEVSVFNKEDLEYLDTRISSIESDVDSYKTSVVDKINEWNIPEERRLSSTSTFVDINNTLEYIKGIPNVGASLVDSANNQLYLKPDGSITADSSEAKLDGSGNPCTINISVCEANNMSAGSTAWVDGNIVIGNGNDNKSYYDLGYAAGLAELNNSNIEYVYHSHSDACIGTVTKTCTITKRFTTENHPAAWNSIWCGTCNANTYHDGMKTTHSACGQATTYSILNCSKHANNSNYYSVSTHTYTGSGYICGYNEGDIESATIKVK